MRSDACRRVHIYVHSLPFSGFRLSVRATETGCGESLGRIKYELQTLRAPLILPCLFLELQQFTSRSLKPPTSSHPTTAPPDRRSAAGKPCRCTRCILRTRHSNIGIHMSHNSDVTRHDGSYFRHMAGLSASLVVVYMCHERMDMLSLTLLRRQRV